MADRNGCLESPDKSETTGAFSTGWKPGGAIDSRLLLGTSNTVTIRHGDETYTLRETRAGKLILTK